MEELRTELEQAASTDERAAALWQRVETSGPAQLPFILFMKSDSYLPMPKPELGNDLIDFDAGAKLIREAGGIAMMAHWFFYERDFPREALESILKAGRLDGVETAVVNEQNELDISTGTSYLRELSDRLGTAQCLGIDAHYEQDFALFAEDDNAQRSIGQTKRLIDRYHPDLTWSNIEAH